MVEVYDVETKKDNYRYERKSNEFIMEDSRYCDSNSINNLICYASDEKKTRGYYGGINCSDDPEEAIEVFLEVKEQFDQCYGQQLKHILISFDRRIERKKADQYAKKILDYFFDGFQCFYGIHFENCRTHIHVVINSVSYEDGRRLIITEDNLRDIRAYIMYI
jgi:Relaxase/Mobilisation nuclease domain.